MIFGQTSTHQLQISNLPPSPNVSYPYTSNLISMLRLSNVNYFQNPPFQTVRCRHNFSNQVSKIFCKNVTFTAFTLTQYQYSITFIKGTLQHTLLSSLTTELILTQTKPIQFLCICQQSTVSFQLCQFLNQLDCFVVLEIL